MTIASHTKRYPAAAWTLGLVLAGLILATTGFSWSYGRVESNSDTHSAFVNKQIPKNYTYYYFGRTNMPYAIVGLEPPYNLRSRLWRKIDPNSEAFGKMIEWTWWDSVYYPNYPRGKDIQDPEGKKIGIWYSSARWAAVRMLDGQGGVMIAPDAPWGLGRR